LGGLGQLFCFPRKSVEFPIHFCLVYLELSVAMRNLWCLEKKSILPFIISATGIVPQFLFKNLKILDLGNTLVVEIQKGIKKFNFFFIFFNFFIPF
jgi:hypothetical protein